LFHVENFEDGVEFLGVGHKGVLVIEGIPSFFAIGGGRELGAKDKGVGFNVIFDDLAQDLKSGAIEMVVGFSPLNMIVFEGVVDLVDVGMYPIALQELS